MLESERFSKVGQQASTELMTNDYQVDTYYFKKHSGQRVIENIFSLKPNDLLSMLRLFEHDELVCGRMISKVLDGLKHH